MKWVRSLDVHSKAVWWFSNGKFNRFTAKVKLSDATVTCIHFLEEKKKFIRNLYFLRQTFLNFNFYVCMKMHLLDIFTAAYRFTIHTAIKHIWYTSEVTLALNWAKSLRWSGTQLAVARQVKIETKVATTRWNNMIVKQLHVRTHSYQCTSTVQCITHIHTNILYICMVCIYTALWLGKERVFFSHHRCFAASGHNGLPMLLWWKWKQGHDLISVSFSI